MNKEEETQKPTETYDLTANDLQKKLEEMYGKRSDQQENNKEEWIDRME